MQYTITDVTNNMVTVEFSDGSWAQVIPTQGMTEEDFDELIFQFAPKESAPLDFISVGSSRVAQEKAVVEEEQPVVPEWLQNRQNAYGTLTSQIEYITENGLDAWQSYVAEIKAANPKS